MLGVVELREVLTSDEDNSTSFGEVTDRLIYVRNPWAEDTFNGTYSNPSVDFNSD